MTRPGLTPRELLAIAERLRPPGTGEDWPPVSLSDRRRAAQVLIGLASEMLSQAPAHRRADQDSQFFAALEVALRPVGTSVADAKEDARKRWRFSDEKMRRAWLDHHEQAKDIVRTSSNRAALASVVEQQWQMRCKKSR
jgi:hypothetical protein